MRLPMLRILSSQQRFEFQPKTGAQGPEGIALNFEGDAGAKEAEADHINRDIFACPAGVGQGRQDMLCGCSRKSMEHR